MEVVNGYGLDVAINYHVTILVEGDGVVAHGYYVFHAEVFEVEDVGSGEVYFAPVVLAPHSHGGEVAACYADTGANTFNSSGNGVAIFVHDVFAGFFVELIAGDDFVSEVVFNPVGHFFAFRCEPFFYGSSNTFFKNPALGHEFLDAVAQEDYFVVGHVAYLPVFAGGIHVGHFIGSLRKMCLTMNSMLVRPAVPVPACSPPIR